MPTLRVMGGPPVTEPPPDQAAPPAIDHLFDGDADPAAERPDADPATTRPEDSDS
jgi:hypothetical protein